MAAGAGWALTLKHMAQNTGAVALVTAAGRGIGRAIALRLAQDGYAVVASDIDDSSAEVVAEIEQAGGVAAAKTADVADADQVAALLQFTLERFGRLDAAVNNAGVGAMPKRLAEVSLAEWQRAIDVTLTGTFLSMHAELAHFDAQGAGVVVNIASIASLMANPQLTPYGASKHGVASLTTSAAVEYAPRGIRINAVAPVRSRPTPWRACRRRSARSTRPRFRPSVWASPRRSRRPRPGCSAIRPGSSPV